MAYGLTELIIPGSAVYEAEGDKLLVQLLQDQCQGAVAHAAAILSNMAAQEALRSSALAQGAIRALVEPLQATNSRVLASATLAVAALACDADGRADVSNLLHRLLATVSCTFTKLAVISYGSY